MIHVDARPGDRVRITIEAVVSEVQVHDGMSSAEIRSGVGPWIGIHYGATPDALGGITTFAVEIPADQLDVYADVEVTQRREGTPS